MQYLLLLVVAWAVQTSADPCVCKPQWADTTITGCSATQKGCTNCDGDVSGSWCHVTDSSCDTASLVGQHTQAWSYCADNDCDITTVAQDVYLLLDYSGSVDAQQWQQQIDFAAEIVLNQLPGDTRVAAQGFGSDITATDCGYWNGNKPKSWYFGWEEKTCNGVTTPAYDYTAVGGRQAIADKILSWEQYGGKTYLESGIDNLLNAGNIDFDADTDRKRLLIIMTDGEASDNPCTQRAALDTYNIETLIIGIGSGFAGDGVSCLVDNPAEDIVRVNDFDNLGSYVDFIGQIVCQTTTTEATTQTPEEPTTTPQLASENVDAATTSSPTNPCVCKPEWSDTSIGSCGETQYGCTNCDNDFFGSWCHVTDNTCDDVRITGAHWQGWAYCGRRNLKEANQMSKKGIAPTSRLLQ